MTNGRAIALNYTKEANHRIFVGLGWDPNEKITFMQELGNLIKGTPIHHDLDLACLFYDEDANLIGFVSADPAHEEHQGGKIYHSGDNPEGLGDGDDEEISVELKDLDEKIKYIIFYTVIKTEQSFAEVTAPEIHLADGYSGRDFLHVDLKKADGNDKSAFIFCKIHRDGEDWFLTNISEFTDDKEKWSDFLKDYLN